MDPFKISAAAGRTKCWCGRDATITRSGIGIESHYCSEHWALWWEYALPDLISATIQSHGLPA